MNLTSNVNLLAVLIATFASMAIGMMWYSNALFGKAFLNAVGASTSKAKKDLQKQDMGKTYGLMLLSFAFMAFVLANILPYLGANNAIEGALAGFWLCAGFVVTTSASGVLFEKRKLELYLISNGYYLVCGAVMGAIIAIIT
ncbi:DUF1761 domain-containing protein [Candidatus Parvarchaeota archaeon]|nr:DUF1761 domain-containing protein [Candidatus Parvarchaeota archaeon]